MAISWLFAHTYPVKDINETAGTLVIDGVGSGVGGTLRVPEDPIEVGDTFSIVGSSTAWTVVGFSDGGIVGFTFGFGNVLFSNDTTLSPDDVRPFDTGSLPVCFLAGTMIATPRGGVAVEDLAPGDIVCTAEGTLRPVAWVGRQTCHTRFADPLRALPVRISRGALGDGLPRRDLCVSPDHALLVGGILVQAGALVNDTSIRRVAATSLPGRFVYYHVELEDHSLLLAEGVPAETFLDTASRRRFDNFHEYEERFGAAVAPIEEMALPRVKSARQLARAIHADLAGPAH